MSEGGWGGAAGWGEDGRQREELPKLESLPIADQGYDREAVREAFDAFYRHAAQLDSTLRILESVEVFGRQARELRADIRSLRAASWGPAPSARHVWSVGHEAWSPEEPPAAFAASLPRLGAWAALIVAVGVGAALAELGTVLIVLLVVSAWALVALIEVVLASRRAAAVPAELAPAEPAPGAAEGEPRQEQEAAPASAAQDTMIVPAATASEAVRVEDEPVSAEQEHASAEPEPGSEPEPAVVDEVSVPGPTSRRRFWQRRAEPVPDDTDEVPALAPASWRSDDSSRGDPWEAGEDAAEAGEPLVTAPPPSRGLLRRGRR